MKAIILSIGDELCLGQTVDTNSAWMSRELAAVGCDVRGHATVADDQADIARAIREAAGRCDVLIVSGGLGPTEDDLTRFALADVLNEPLEENADQLAKLQAFFARLTRTMPERNKVQVMLPRGVSAIDNPNGTACGMLAVIEIRDEGGTVLGGNAFGGTDLRSVSGSDVSPRHGPEVRATKSAATTTRCYFVPGVPKEMKAMFLADILPGIAAASEGKAIRTTSLHTFGLGESTIAERLGELMDRKRNPLVGTTVSGGIVSIRIGSRFENVSRASEELDATIAEIQDKLGSIVFGRDDETLSGVVTQLLIDRSQTISVAESCTGGLLGKMLTDLGGSSKAFMGGFLTYSNDSKRDRLGVPQEMLNVFGAVSEQVVERMARSTRRLFATDYAIAISGIAGPGGGSETKPVGTVCIALAAKGKSRKPTPGQIASDDATVTTRTFVFPGDRDMIRDRAAKMALLMLRSDLRGEPFPF